MKPVRNHVIATRHAGAALVVSLIILVILTLLGIAAIRASRLELRLSQNAESRMQALEAAQAFSDAITNNAANLNIGQGPGYNACYLAAGNAFNITALTNYADPLFGSCTSNTLALPTSMASYPNTYGLAKRDTPTFVTVGAIRGAGLSGRSYQFARFIVIAGYDSTGDSNSPTEVGQGAAEVNRGILKLNVKAQGVNYQ
jgi:hypothetical protein